MIRLVTFLLIVGLVAVGAAWLADRPGEIVLTWQGYRIETSLMAAGFLLLLLVAFIMALITGLRIVFGSPGAFRGFMRSRRKSRGYHALSRGMIAVGAGDARLAQRYAQQARKILEDEPLTLLLTAQTAQLSGDQDMAQRTFQAMLDSSETETLGLRGLFIEAQRRGDALAARGYAERALKINEATPWAGEAVFEMQSAAGDWKGAIATLARNQANKIIDKTSAKRLRAVLLTAQALQTDRSQSDHALALANEAHQLAPDLVPAAVVTGRLLTKSGNVRRATKVLEKAWKLSPHPDIAAAYMEVRPGDTARDRLKRMRGLVARTPQAREASIALATAAIDARQWDEARRVLEPHLKRDLSQRICSLMAEIEDAQTSDTGKVREWLARAVKAPRDAMWIADGVGSPVWAPISPVTGRLDAFEWKAPAQTATAQDALMVERAPAAADETAKLPPLAAADLGEDSQTANARADILDDIADAEMVEAAIDVDASPAPTQKAAAAATIDNERSTAAAQAKPAAKQAEQPAAAPQAAPKAATPDKVEAKPKPDSGPGSAPALADGMIESETIDADAGFAVRPPDDPGPDGELFDDDAVSRQALR